MLSELISALLQILVFTLIPFLVFLINKKRERGFFEYIGLKKSNTKANLMALAIALVFLIPPIILAIVNPGFKEVMHDPQSMTGKFKAMGFTFESLVLILLAAIFKTALAEEILFRGFIAKRLIAITNYQKGNLIQAVLFGIIHSLLFISISSNILFLVMIFLFPALAAYLMCYLNEKLADGSIIPGWIAHAVGNVLSYVIIGFLI